MAVRVFRPIGRQCTETAARAGERPGVRRFLRDVRGGATSIMATMVAVMTVAAAALIVDHNWLVDQRDTMKNAADAAAVAATIEMKRPGVQGKNASELADHLKGVAETYVKLNLSHLSGERLTKAKSSLTVTATPDDDGNTVRVTASADLGGTLFSRHLPIMGNYTGPSSVRTVAMVEGASNPIEVVLAIDISTSMDATLDKRPAKADGSDSRMAIVKRAATALVDILGPNAENRVAVGLVPWQAQVRLDETLKGQWRTVKWAKYPKKRHYGAIYTCSPIGNCTSRPDDQGLADEAPEDWRGCVDEQRVDGDGHAKLPPGNPPTEAALLSLPSPENPFAQGIYASTYGFAYECLQSQLPANLLYHDCYSTPGTGSSSKIYGPYEAQRFCPADASPILPLSPVASDVKDAIGNLKAVGLATYSALGVLWGQRLLTPGWKQVWGDDVHPVDPASEDGTGARKAIVLLTDGEDNQCGPGDPSCEHNQVGIKRQTACDMAKKAGIEVFVIAAMHPDQVSGTLGASLKACSSEADDSDGKYVFLNNADAESLETAFADIANQLKVFRRVY